MARLLPPRLRRPLSPNRHPLLRPPPHQLRLLRRLGLVRTRREGRTVYYTLDDEHVRTLYRQALDHVGHGDASGSDE